MHTRAVRRYCAVVCGASEPNLKTKRTNHPPAGLYIVDRAVECDTSNSVQEDALMQGRSPPCSALQVHGGLHVDKRKGDELSDAACALLQAEEL
jgi:hypothetical protein